MKHMPWQQYDIDRVGVDLGSKDRRARTLTLYDLVVPRVEARLCRDQKAVPLSGIDEVLFHLRSMGSGNIAGYFNGNRESFVNDLVCTVIRSCTQDIADALLVGPYASVIVVAQDGFVRFRTIPKRLDRRYSLYGVGVSAQVKVDLERTNLVVPFTHDQMDLLMDAVRESGVDQVFVPRHYMVKGKSMAAILTLPEYPPSPSAAVAVGGIA